MDTKGSHRYNLSTGASPRPVERGNFVSLSSLPARRALGSLRVRVCLVLATALVLLSVTAPAPASAEPIYYFMRCRPITGGEHFKITRVQDCRWGYIYITNSYDSRVSHIDMYKLEIQMKKGGSLSAVVKSCLNNFICGTIVGDFVLKKVKIAYRWLKPLIK
jgi:hypothetical protein